MTTKKFKGLTKSALLSAAIALLVGNAQAARASKDYIVEGQDAASVAKEVSRVGSQVTVQLPIVNGVSARLSIRQAARLGRDTHLQIFADAPLQNMSVKRWCLMSISAT